MFQSVNGEKSKDTRGFLRSSAQPQSREAEASSMNPYSNQALLRTGRPGSMLPITPLRPSQTAVLQRKCAACEEEEKKMLQTKLAIGASNDPLEQEANRMADQVLVATPHARVSGIPLRMQRDTEQESAQTDMAPVGVDRVLAGSGKPMEPVIKQDMEQRFGYDFSSVQLHLGGAAEQSAREVNAHAYTVGHNIVFGQGQYAPTTHEGRRLIAHELSHVLQQSVSPTPILQREIEPANSLDDTDTDDPMDDYETGADNEVAPDEVAVANEEAPFFAEACGESQAEPLGGGAGKPSSGKSILVKLPQTLIRFEGSKNIGAWGISGGKPGHGTPKGPFKIIWRDLNHTSNSYGTCDGTKIGPNGESKCKKKGGTYVGADMHYFQQFTTAGGSKIGFHRGDPNVKSHGCIHLSSGNAKTLWDWSAEGTPVLVK